MRAGSSRRPAKLSSKSRFIRSWRLSRSRRGSHLRTVTGESSGGKATTMESTSWAEALAKLVEQGQGLERGQVLQVQPAQVLEHRFLGAAEEGELPSAGGRRGGLVAAGQSRPAFTVELGALEVAQDLLGAGHHGSGKPGQAGDLDPERAVRPPGLDLAQEHDRVVPLARGYVEVAD